LHRLDVLHLDNQPLLHLLHVQRVQLAFHSHEPRSEWKKMQTEAWQIQRWSFFEPFTKRTSPVHDGKWRLSLPALLSRAS
jgi:hypothetical protein